MLRVGSSVLNASIGAAAVLALLPAAAAAQPEVAIYGIVDTGVEYISNVAGGAHVLRMPNLTGSITSRLGFRGTEDLGGGLSALFTLESGFATDSGIFNIGGRAFGRQAWVGLSGPLGTVTIGRNYTMTYWVLGGLDYLGANIYTWGVFDPYLTGPRTDNSVAYRGKFGNLTLGATYSVGRDAVPVAAGGANCPGEGATDSKACKDYSLMVRYDTAGWGVASSYEQMRGGSGAGSGLGSSDLTDTRAILGGWGKLGSATFGGGVVLRDNDGGPAGLRKSKTWFASGSYPVTAQLVLDASVGQIRYDDSAAKASDVAGRLSYNFSKRTAAYVTVSRVWNGGTTAFPVSGGSAGGTAPLAGGDQTGVMVGLRHSF